MDASCNPLVMIRFRERHGLRSRKGDVLMNAAGCVRPVLMRLAEVLARKGVVDLLWSPPKRKNEYRGAGKTA